ncbi:BREX-1 system adenine-specific DNA-methyltransferase PglX [Pseudomonas rhodesiae]|uniref:BREX-1 system adenine-specific DNA-methyltransferase PglX n=1 Tax=Pseudomonas rhodesiae TaxID=76760 RepID=UPI001F23974C|nr:BREX-1 system adenine-specific DNA-methyltransferase PglX [Pseudomonas rhodesiae]
MNQAAQKDMARYFFRASSMDFKKIPGSPIAYWASESALKVMSTEKQLGEISAPRQGLATSDDQRFLRLWHEVALGECCLESRTDDHKSRASKKWLPFVKGGSARRWFGNNDILINWGDDGAEVKEYAEALYGSVTRTIKNIQFYFKEMISWSLISGGSPSFRLQSEGQVFGHKGPGLFSSGDLSLESAISFLNSKVASYLLSYTSPNLSYEVGAVQKLPVISVLPESRANDFIGFAKRDWNSYETSWDFASLSLLLPDYRQSTLQATYLKLRSHWRETTLEMQRLEEENNRIFIDAYGLQEELTPEIPIKDITLTCNPHYRYGGDKSEEEFDTLLMADTMREFLSYAVGCMFGRYSLDQPGLVLANQGENLADYLRQIPVPSFMPDEDNVIPLLDGEWFADDVTERFRAFLRLTFGERHYEGNLAFIEASLGKDVRKYFTKDFYTDHVKRYKKRPIYWLFASPKGTFSALIYLHRYRQDTVSVVLQYLRDFRKKLADELSRQQTIVINPNAEQTKKTKAQKAAEILKKQLLELDDYERDTLYPLATKQVQLNLDDGVKFNYLQLGPALKKIAGLEAKED